MNHGPHTEITSREAKESLVSRFAHLSTGMKMLLWLSVALLPLVVIIIFASLQTTSSADFERRSLLRVALSESARRLGAEIATDVMALRVSADAFADDRFENRMCDRAASILSTTAGDITRFAVLNKAGTKVCGTPGFVPALPAEIPQPGVVRTQIDPQERHLAITLASDGGRFIATAIYTDEKLSRLSRPASFGSPYILRLKQDNRILTLVDGFNDRPFSRIDTLAAPVSQMPFLLEMSVRKQPLSASETVTMLLPLLMWAAAAIIGWLVVDRLILRPLFQLRTAVAAYQPGQLLEPYRQMSTPAKEIRELGDTFRAITETVAAHEAQLALGLSRQTRLTREVHHRVKNNLQVVSSLINLHARGAKSSEAVEAYASIQRRVDALAVVHRNHYADMEENRGVALRPLVGEIAANLRGNAPPAAARLTIMLNIPPYYVSQDVAVPVAFMITELVELAMMCDPKTNITIAVEPMAEENRGHLIITSPALADSRKLRAKLAERYGRVLEGLARQLRAPLERDEKAGKFSVSFATLGSD